MRCTSACINGIMFLKLFISKQIKKINGGFVWWVCVNSSSLTPSSIMHSDIFILAIPDSIQRGKRRSLPVSQSTWSSTPAPYPRRRTSDSSWNPPAERWCLLRCSSPSHVSSCEREKPRKLLKTLRIRLCFMFDRQYPVNQEDDVVPEQNSISQML